MKKIVTAALVIGLLAAPSIAAAMQGADDINHANDVRQEDRRPVTTAASANLSAQANVNDQNDNTVNDVQQNNRVDNDVNDDNNNKQNTQTPQASSITISQAISIAMNAMPGKTIERVQMEQEEGVQVFSVRFVGGSRVDVRASDGTVLRQENQTQGQNDNSGPGHHDGQEADNDN